MNNKAKCIVALGAFIILSVAGFFLLPRDEIVIQNNHEEKYIYVHIEGCVHEPGLAKVKYGTRLYELIEQVGGATEDADLTRVNLASVLIDEQKIIIPEKVEAAQTSDTSDYQGSLININTASKAVLEQLNGIGPSMATSIIEYRERVGYFLSIEDIMNVQGIGQSKFDKIKDSITI